MYSCDDGDGDDDDDDEQVRHNFSDLVSYMIIWSYLSILKKN